MCIQRSHYYTQNGRALPRPAGHYLIPADQFAAVVARSQWQPSILNCFQFVPLARPCPCPPAPVRPVPPPSPRLRRR